MDGQHVSPSSITFQDALRNSYLAHARPRCLCTPAAPSMYVAHVGDTFVLKRMPGSGSQHAPWCQSSHPAENGAPWEKPPGVYINAVTGRTQLRVAFALHDSSRPPSCKQAGPPAADAFHAGCKVRMSLQDLLVFLWQRAELTHWHPGFAGRRNWAVVRARLLNAARALWLGDVPLSSLLFVPEAFNRNAWKAIQSRRNVWLQALRETSGARQLVLAELKTATQVGHVCRLMLRHLPDMAFGINPALARMTCSPREADQEAAPTRRQMVLVTVSALSDAEPRIHRATSICCDRNWLPLRSSTAVHEPRPPGDHRPLPSPRIAGGTAVADLSAAACPSCDQYGQVPR